MICVLAIPAYRQTIHARTAMALAQDAMTCLINGWRPAPLYVDNSGIPRARNVIVTMAEQAGADLLLMCDSDTFPMLPEGGLGSMYGAMRQHDAAVVGAAVVTRNGSRVNCEPARPGESYEGEVGTGYMLIDMRRLADLPRPWFVHRDTPDGLRVACGEDIYFCRHAKAHGHKVIVNYALPMGHADQQFSSTFSDS